MSWFDAHKCPQCGETVPWRRLWGLSWAQGPWECGGCGAQLRVNMTRRSNLTFISTAFVCGLMAACFATTWSLAALLVPGFLLIWYFDTAAVAAPAKDL